MVCGAVVVVLVVAGRVVVVVEVCLVVELALVDVVLPLEDAELEVEPVLPSGAVVVVEDDSASAPVVVKVTTQLRPSAANNKGAEQLHW